MTVFGIDELPVKPRMRGWIHLWAFGVAVVAGAVLVVLSQTVADPPAGWSTVIYSLTVCGVFGVSALYHRVHWHDPRARTWMKRADHSMIFLFIAGSYTPFATLALPPETGRMLLTVVWTGALAGVALKMLWPTAPRWVGVPLYLLLGWAIVPVAGQLTDEAGIVPMVLLLVGGILYSIGAILYATKWPDPWPHVFGYHEFFHAATVLAALCHAVAVWLVVFG
ncbi:hemolysin III family protein [Rhodococcus ruber]|uniref:PAQR family membrane homeostasis protein TrhA n=1 Tax=Rhodococcus TaxID=1827 RepID=UPI000E6B14BB|nr:MULTISPECIES: hemolysin III family protein [Rhodococcus]AXY51104.1 hemolytic factor [Rhodococcus ruber]UQB74193.1 hemolysin III family protein [Rhodococcus ruber]WML64232.1 hemolysin III family protein [Rhodococcus sp. AH-ZY2]